MEREDWIRDNPDDPDVPAARESTWTHWQPRASAAISQLLDWCGTNAGRDLFPHLPETLEG